MRFKLVFAIENMKKQLILLLYLSWALSGCKSTGRVKWNISKTISLPFSIDKTGPFVTSSVLTSGQILNVFDPAIGRPRAYAIESMSINSFNIAGTVDPKINSATQVVVSAVVNGASAKPLLNNTKLIYLGNNQLLQDVNDIVNGNTGETNNPVSYATTLKTINIVGVQEIQKILSENLTRLNTNGLRVTLSGTVPPGQRLVGTIVLTVNATLSVYNCQEKIGIFSALESCD